MSDSIDFGEPKPSPKTKAERSVPRVRSADQVAAMTIGDLHWSHNPPLFRSVEKDWYKVQEGYVDQVEEFWKHRGKPPLLVAGDIFDDGWREKKCPPELINFAIKQFARFEGEVYAVPGNHDLPHHQLSQLHKSAYWTLVKARVIKDCSNHSRIPGGKSNIVIHGFPCGRKIRTYEVDEARPVHPEHFIHIALCHDYIWASPEDRHLGAKEDTHYLSQTAREAYDVVVYGDNHKGFIVHTHPRIINGGTFMRRRSDDADYSPFVGLIFGDGDVTSIELDTEKDKYLTVDPKGPIDAQDDIEGLVELLKTLGDGDLDYIAAVKSHVRRPDLKISKAVQDLVISYLDQR